MAVCCPRDLAGTRERAMLLAVCAAPAGFRWAPSASRRDKQGRRGQGALIIRRSAWLDTSDTPGRSRVLENRSLGNARASSPRDRRHLPELGASCPATTAKSQSLHHRLLVIGRAAEVALLELPLLASKTVPWRWSQPHRQPRPSVLPSDNGPRGQPSPRPPFIDVHHATARRYQRSFADDDEAVYRDLGLTLVAGDRVADRYGWIRVVHLPTEHSDHLQRISGRT
jgi:hypothetical protein